MPSQLPDKLYFKIGEVSKLAKVAPHVLRYWESEFSTIKPKRAGSKQRLYRRKDVELILTIKNLLHNQGYTIAGAKKLISEADDLDSIKIEEEKTKVHYDRLVAIKDELLEIRNLLDGDK
ncbi:MAG: MerR family transcriptional regulator [Desulfofustis sp.]|nr:MerR family transcriptional regulator [Desulfofustis sp.]MBT8346901.1 MerR family transcriptional regulator [Desulfofustis sp.]MBT8355567.1 MerR family transcriptional regulator [Desulfofustis sp.]NNK15073.1 MerR family transcriptional regulator [Desulfofustis sp.]NNK57784.1 MerR family transcriptional regulator [Desulfofustis sp.]